MAQGIFGAGIPVSHRIGNAVFYSPSTTALRWMYDICQKEKVSSKTVKLCLLKARRLLYNYTIEIATNKKELREISWQNY